MKIAIMQPYVFPYIGYFQLIKSVDLFVFYNDVNFIKKGWIHRNRILLNKNEFLFTVPCEEISQNKRICDTKIANDDFSKKKFLANINQAYKKAPHFNVVYELIEKTISKKFVYIDELAINTVREICSYLSITTRFEISDKRYNNETLKKADRLIDICIKENCKNYVNPVGGQEIYTKEYFRNKEVELQFLKPGLILYNQFNNEFVPWLSIIDVLMFNDKAEVIRLLNNYELI